MFAHISGTVDEIGVGRVVVDVHGVGYELLCSDITLKGLGVGMEARLLTHFHIAQDSVALYGFGSAEERGMFRKLIAVTRVGPKLALSVLSHLTASDIATAVFTDNVAAFDRVPGMGRKTASRVLLELKEKVTELLPGREAPADGGSVSMRTEAIAALVALGYDGVSAGRAVSAVGECEKVEDMITLALREMVKGR